MLGCCFGPPARLPLPCCLTAGARAAEPFYKGKRLTLLIGAASGGPTDIEGPVAGGSILGRHIEGHPSLLVLNKEGAVGGVVGATFLGEVAPRDGTMLGYLSGTAWNFVNEPERAGGSTCAVSSSWRSSPARPFISCVPTWASRHEGRPPTS